MSYNNNASQEVSDYIINNIQSGVWKPGDKIWSESEFCAHLDVSRIAVRDAIASLSAISVLKKVKGSGTYVEDPDNVSLEGIRCFLMKTEDMLELMEFRHIMDSYCTEPSPNAPPRRRSAISRSAIIRCFKITKIRSATIISPTNST